MPQHSIKARSIIRQRYFVIQNTDAIRVLIFPIVCTFFVWMSSETKTC